MAKKYVNKKDKLQRGKQHTRQFITVSTLYMTGIYTHYHGDVLARWSLEIWESLHHAEKEIIH
jgi:hypothetical protein